MPVPGEDLICRFVKPENWSRRDHRPKAGAFKQVDLSVWHPESLYSRGARLEDLKIENLAGYGEAHHTVSDYGEAARTAGSGEQGQLDIVVEWRPECQYVREPWWPWRYAHAQVETLSDKDGLMTLFRRQLALTTRHAVPPIS